MKKSGWRHLGALKAGSCEALSFASRNRILSFICTSTPSLSYLRPKGRVMPGSELDSN